MKKVLFAGAGALALVMGAAAAQAQEVSTGYVGLSYSDVSVSGGGATVISGDGTVAFDLSDSWTFQLDGNVGTVNPDGSGSGSTVWGSTGHFFYDTDNFKAGAFVGYQDLSDSFGFDTTATGYGLEGRWAASDTVTLGALAAWGTLNLHGAPDMDVTAYKADISIFSSDNLRWDASYSANSFDWGPFSGDSNVWSIGGEYQLADSPTSFTFGYSSASSDLAGNDAKTWSVGVRRTFGGSLKDRDRTSSPFLGLPFDFGGIAGLIAGQGSVFNSVARCFDDEESCPSESAIDNWIDGFDEDSLDDLICELFDECNNDD